MPLAQLPQPFDHHDFIFEVKYDGFRSLCYLESGSVRLVSRNGNPYKSFSELCRALADCLNVKTAVLDGEIVFLGQGGRPEFYNLMRRRRPQYFAAFDLLWLNGKDLRWLPLLERKRVLKSIVPAQPASIFYVDFDHRGVDLFRVVCDSDLEGVVAKLKTGVYDPTSTTWIKIKNRAYSQAVGRHEFFG